MLTAYLLTTEVGYDVYLGEPYGAPYSFSTYNEALAFLHASRLWNGKIEHGTSRYMPCQ